jgi:putative spermidine/putrescine transport system substrate-binding protein
MSANDGHSTRRNLLKLTGAATAGLAMPAVFTGRAFGAEQITLADTGGAPGAAFRQAFYDPFEKETGIRIVSVAHEANPVVQFKMSVDSSSDIWDACLVTPAHVQMLTEDKNYLEPLGIPAEEGKVLMPDMLTDNWLGISVYAVVMAYRSDKFGENGPRNWAEFWNVEKFPGRRGLYRGCNGMLEQALMADGVPAKELYPLDVDRAFKMLDTIKPHVAVWWTSGAQNTQILQNGEVDLSDTWGGRANAARASGAPVEVVWSEGTFSVDGWSMPVGCKRADLVRKFLRFSMDPHRQAAYGSLVANGPTNLDSYKYIEPQHARTLPTFPDNLKGLVQTNDAWWTENQAAVIERFEDWLLS